jgi:imidazole glycerol phosphate synthase glutamine amidotransferase subunit
MIWAYATFVNASARCPVPRHLPRPASAIRIEREAPEQRGLGIFPGTVRRVQGDVRIPHMGWNQLEPKRSARLLRDAGEKPFVYFAHSYYCPLVGGTAATCDYTVPYTALLEHENVYGVQFHPEKSGAVGLSIVRNFVEL